MNFRPQFCNLCLSVNFAKILKTLFYIEDLRWLGFEKIVSYLYNKTPGIFKKLNLTSILVIRRKPRLIKIETLIY